MTPSDLKTQMTKKFIDKVQNNKCLYDSNAKKNVTSQQIENIWQKIADECGLQTTSQAKRKWAYLASQYKNGLQNPAKKSKHHSDLNFLYSVVQTIDDVTDDEVEFLMKQEPMDDGPERPMSSVSGSNNSNCWSMENRPTTSSGRHSVLSNSRYSQRSLYAPSEAPHMENTDDELKPLFESWYRSTKKLPIAWQLHVKGQISQIINIAEMGAASGAVPFNEH